ncbi:MAG: hypothetical protein Q3972_01525 [Corynebacterium sp.]|nr:hypothetical protein [Corynebacterium sp.]
MVFVGIHHFNEGIRAQLMDSLEVQLLLSGVQNIPRAEVETRARPQRTRLNSYFSSLEELCLLTLARGLYRWTKEIEEAVSTRITREEFALILAEQAAERLPILRLMGADLTCLADKSAPDIIALYQRIEDGFFAALRFALQSLSRPYPPDRAILLAEGIYINFCGVANMCTTSAELQFARLRANSKRRHRSLKAATLTALCITLTLPFPEETA